MKFKVIIPILSLCFLGVWFRATAQSSKDRDVAVGGVGRFQVIEVSLDAPAQPTLNHRTAPKIDTVTGRTWELTPYKSQDGEPNLA